MEFYQRVKQKLADELEVESPLEYPEGNGSNDVESLKQEIEELKHHLNSNYDVYVRRLEKSKAKRKDLEANLREVTAENERLSREADQGEIYRGKLEEYREQLEQLESYQSQELAKVKHMLLSAEAELETEKKKNLNQLHDTSGLAKIDFRREVENSSNDQVTSSDFKLNGDGGSDIDSEELSKLKRNNQVLQSKLVDVMSDRDAMKANLLELEIANHECDQVKFNQIEALKVEISKLQAEIETLNATLNVRNGEIRAKKEDLKREKESHTYALKNVESTTNRLSDAEAEIKSLKCTLSERLMQLREAQKFGDQLQEKVESVENNLNKKENLLSDMSFNSKELADRCEKLSEETSCLQNVIDGLNTECDRQREQITALHTTNLDHVETLKVLTSEKSAIKEELIQLEESIPSFIESSDLVKSMKEKEKFLQDELEEKKQAVRQLQIRSNEMKKMLQKEMKSGGGGGSGDPAPNAATSHANGLPESPGRNITPTFSHVFSHDFKDSPSPHSEPEVISSVTLAYMRHVILKFLTSPEVESKQMTRALATILQLTKEEELRLQAYLDWKMSWFAGPKPKLLL